jgi:hypothetical protein
MILHCSKKLAAKRDPFLRVPLAETNPLGSWHGHVLFTVDRRERAMFCVDATRACRLAL